MPVTVIGNRIDVDGIATVEDVELVVAGFESGAADLDLTRASHVHAAVLQAILAYRPSILPPEADGPLAEAVAVLNQIQAPKAAA